MNLDDAVREQQEFERSQHTGDGGAAAWGFIKGIFWAFVIIAVLKMVI